MKKNNLKNLGGNLAKVVFESCGKFSLPVECYLRDFKVKEINQLNLIRDEDVFETAMSIIDDCIQDDNFSILDATFNELYEILVAMQVQFNLDFAKKFPFSWIDECQNGKVLSEKLSSSWELDLRKLTSKSIIAVEDELKELQEKQLRKLSSEDFISYLKLKYNITDEEAKNITIEQELEKFVIKEPFTFTVGGNAYGFRLQRVRDLVDGSKYIKSKFGLQEKRIREKSYKQMDKETQNYMREEELEILDQEKNKEITNFLEFRQLVSYNGDTIENDEHRKQVYSDIDRTVILQINQYLKKIDFGIVHEFRAVCEHCQEERGFLFRQNINPVKLLPLQTRDVENDAADNDGGGNTGIIVSFG